MHLKNVGVLSRWGSNVKVRAFFSVDCTTFLIEFVKIYRGFLQIKSGQNCLEFETTRNYYFQKVSTKYLLQNLKVPFNIVFLFFLLTLAI